MYDAQGKLESLHESLGVSARIDEKALLVLSALDKT